MVTDARNHLPGIEHGSKVQPEHRYDSHQTLEVAEKETRDLNSQEMEMITRARTRMGELNAQAEAMADTMRMSNESAKRLRGSRGEECILDDASRYFRFLRR